MLELVAHLVHLMTATVVEARPASTVVLLRDGENGMESLLLKRNKALMFAGGL